MGPLLRNCSKYGINFVITSTNISGLGFSIESYFPTKIVLNTTDPADADMFFVNPPVIKKNSGRGLVSVNDLVSYNNLGTTVLTVGQQLLIPNKKEENESSDLTYIVKSRDTLWSIAKKYNIPVSELKNLNNLTNNMLSVGQSLVIPETNDYKTYIVKSGDSLYKIARENNINVNDLIKLNNLTNTVLQIGQQLLIP